MRASVFATLVRATSSALLLTLPPAVALAQDPGAEGLPADPPEAAAEPSGDLSPEEILKREFGFEPGPRKARIGTHAELDVPEGFSVTGVEGTRKFLEATNNVVNKRELATLYHLDDGFFIIFEFDAIGYVKDDDKDDLDADAMLESIKEATRRTNEILKERGAPTMEVTGWHTPPHYDEATHNLEWAPKAVDSFGEEVINYNVRLLGRRGVMEAALVVEPAKMAAALPKLRTVLANFRFRAGEDYASFTQGDKIAEYGLTGLVAGGAVAVAAKSGLLGRLWKFIVIGVLALGGFIKRIFGRGRSNP